MINNATSSHERRPNLLKPCVRLIKRAYNAVPYAYTEQLNSDMLFVFIVGCPHSGTTLMTAKLSNHSEIMGIGRETGVFPGNHSLFGIRGIAKEWAYFSERDGHSCILEKTPKHAYYYRLVQKIIPNNKFIVMIRNPLNTVASLYKRFKDLNLSKKWISDNSEALKLAKKAM